MAEIKTVGLIGGGVIGAGWAARCLARGLDVAAWDPAPEGAAVLRAKVANAWPALEKMGLAEGASQDRLQTLSSLEAVAEAADFVQESAPERLEVKIDVHRRIDAAARPTVPIASSTSGLLPSAFQAECAHPERVFVGHPFNPVYLLPLVELVGEADACGRAADILRDIGMFPLHVRKEIDAHIADRFLEAVWREALWLVKDGVATTEEIDEAIRMGFGLRWAQMGLFETYRLAGGAQGMRHFLAQFGPALQWPWTKLTDVPELTEELVARIAEQSDAQSADRSIDDLATERDGNLVAILRALRGRGSAAGRVIAAHEAGLKPAIPAPSPDLPITLDRIVPPTWTDYNGHMNEAHYLESGAAATDRFMEMIGADAAYVGAGGTYFTVENHIAYLAEMREGERLTVTTQVLDGMGKKLHLLHRLHRGDGALAATMETLLLHVDLGTRRSAPPRAPVAERLPRWADAHSGLDAPSPRLALGRS